MVKMNQEKIGKFIAKQRKEKNLTQSELAEKLNITDKAIGNWENGRRLPDYSVLKDLCDILEISVNDLLSGEKVSKENYDKVAEENMMKMIEKSNKVSKEEKIISYSLSIALFIIGLTAILLINHFDNAEVKASVGILNIISLVCIVGCWIATTLSLKNK